VDLLRQLFLEFFTESVTGIVSIVIMDWVWCFSDSWLVVFYCLWWQSC